MPWSQASALFNTIFQPLSLKIGKPICELGLMGGPQFKAAGTCPDSKMNIVDFLE